MRNLIYLIYGKFSVIFTIRKVPTPYQCIVSIYSLNVPSQLTPLTTYFSLLGCANSSKMWDWDGLDLETGSVAGSTGNAAPPIIGPPAILGNPAGMRPNTTAAVAPNNEHGGGFTGLLGGLFNNSRTGSQVFRFTYLPIFNTSHRF